MDGLSFRRQKYNIENAKSSIWRIFFKKEVLTKFRGNKSLKHIVIQSEAKNLDNIKWMYSRFFLPSVVWMTSNRDFRYKQR